MKYIRIGTTVINVDYIASVELFDAKDPLRPRVFISMQPKSETHCFYAHYPTDSGHALAAWFEANMPLPLNGGSDCQALDIIKWYRER